ncbi:MAG: hypothetical protein WBE71_26370, partial [Xanthobacteraceae bacterium]
VAPDNQVTVYEKDRVAGGAFRYAGKAPLFQEVEANDQSFVCYIANLVAACERRGVKFHYATDIAAHPALLEPFDRIVVATGANYRHRGFGHLATWMLDRGLARAPCMARLFSAPKLRNWFYYDARIATGDRFRKFVRPGQKISVIGDAVRAGKSKDAIASAFAAALLPQSVELRESGSIRS